MGARYDLDRLTVRGAPHEMGAAVGRAFTDRIERFVANRFAAIERYGVEWGHPAPRAAVMRIGAESMKIAAEWDPEAHEEHLGIAAGCGLDPVVLYTATNMTDMRDVLVLSAGGPDDEGPEGEGCSALMVPASATAAGHAIAGQTWDLNPEDLDYVVAVNRRPKSGPATWSVTCAGCLTLVGMNEGGLAVGTTNIKTWGSRPGVGYLGILHRMVRSEGAQAAAAAVESAPRAGAHTYWAADMVDQIEVEAAPLFTRRRDASKGPICRTNHCIDPALVAIEGQTPHASSPVRFARMTALLAEGGHTVDSVRAIFANHDDGENSINRRPGDTDFATTNAVFVAVPAERAAWACRGPADMGIWYRLAFEN